MSREFSAGGIVSRGPRLLLVRVRNLRGERVWTFPKGHLEKGETAAAAALREVQEETGWRCRLTQAGRGPFMSARYRFARGKDLVSKRVAWYRMEPLAKVGRPDAREVLAVRWAGTAGAARLLRYPSDVKLLERWSRFPAGISGGRLRTGGRP